MRSTTTVAKQIFDVEGFVVRFPVDDGKANSRRVPDYPYERRASGRWTVAKWRESRCWPAYPDFDVDLLKPDGSPAHGKTLLSTLREAWADEPGGRSAPPARQEASTIEVGDRPLAAHRSRAQATTPRKLLEQTLWEAADKMRGNLEAAEYKHVALGLVFLKYVSDAFEQRRSFLAEATADSESEYFIPNPGRRGEIVESRDEYTSERIFWVPEGARWAYLRSQAKQPTIGVLLDAAMDQIETEHPTLKGVLPKSYAREDIDKRLLAGCIEIGHSP